MVTLSALLIATFASSVVRAVPLQKRIDQTISDSTTQWVAACEAAGGADKCNTLSVNAFQTLLAAGDPCDHQDQADNMIDLAHQLNSDSEMIRLAQIFVQQPRNAPDSLSVLYCQKAPRNSELNGLFQCQFQGCNPTTFTKNVAVGGPGTIPLGMTAPLSPAGSCPANPTGPIADGAQLVTLTEDPGVGGSAPPPASTPDSTPPATSSDTPTATATDTPTATASDVPAATSSCPPDDSDSPASASAASSGTVTVVEGDTCIKIADENGVDVTALMNLNSAINADCTNLQPGQVLILPVSGDDSSSTDSNDSTSTDSNNSTSSADNSPPSGPPVSPPACAAKASKRSFSMSIAKRIAQADLPAVAQSWQDLCLVSGGDIQTNDPCVKLAGLDGINGLLAGSDPCLQQDNADAMIDFAKSDGITNKDALIANAIAYRKHPRNALDIGGGLIPSSPFCQKAPKNQELVGVVNGQLDGVNPGLFGGPKFPVVAFGDPASCPFGQTPDVDTCTCN